MELLKSETLGELAKALVKAQGEMKRAKKESVNPYFESKYADLASVWDACGEALFNNGLAVIQMNAPTENSNDLCVITMLIHGSGEWVAGSLIMKLIKTDPQAIGSAMTYARRYTLSAMVGIAPEDDDAEIAMGRETQREIKPIVKEVAAKKTDVDTSQSNFERFLQAMTDIKKSIGKTMYYVILEKYGFEHANEIKSRAEQEKIYKEMLALQIQLRENQLITDNQIDDILAFIAKQGAPTEQELLHHLRSFYGYESLKEIEIINLYEIYDFLKRKEIQPLKKTLIKEASELYAKLIDEKRTTIEEISNWMAENDMVSFEKATDEQLTKFIKEFTIKDSHF